MAKMIHDSSYWKDDLLKLAQSLEKRILQTRWGGKNLFVVEKEIFLGFYAIRKLIESKKVSDSVSKRKYELREFTYSGDPNSLITHIREAEYDLTSGKTVWLSTVDLCNQFIHSHHFVLFLPDGKHLVGFFFCSDRKRTSGIYLITIFDVVSIYRSVGFNYPASMHMERLPNGKFFNSIE
ncbi:hypothetical protein [Oryzomicrobium sp.]|uniref:hypothetical protein n=1 Tax=Oryzomicrobium sp. TaxID=1911578 RepID=UPI0025EA0DF7|nr:hypothetical protein [Oryzomicrobium sp.]MCE1241932.1 hypothetical protein [Oryzomicrobium sp.]